MIKYCQSLFKRHHSRTLNKFIYICPHKVTDKSMKNLYYIVSKPCYLLLLVFIYSTLWKCEECSFTRYVI